MYNVPDDPRYQYSVRITPTLDKRTYRHGEIDHYYDNIFRYSVCNVMEHMLMTSILMTYDYVGEPPSHISLLPLYEAIIEGRRGNNRCLTTTHINTAGESVSVSVALLSAFVNNRDVKPTLQLRGHDPKAIPNIKHYSDVGYEQAVNDIFDTMVLFSDKMRHFNKGHDETATILTKLLSCGLLTPYMRKFTSKAFKLLLSVYNKDRSAFKSTFSKLVRDDIPIKSLNENIMIELDGSDVVHPLMHYFGFQECLNATTGDILVTKTSKKSNGIYYENDVKYNCVNRFNVFFTTKDDVNRFFENYESDKNMSDTYLLPFNKSSLNSNSTKPIVHYFNHEHNVAIEERLKNTSIPIDVHDRKTPYRPNVHGYLELSSVIINDREGFFEGLHDDAIHQHIEDIRVLLRKWSCDDTLTFSTGKLFRYGNNFNGNGEDIEIQTGIGHSPFNSFKLKDTCELDELKDALMHTSHINSIFSFHVYPRIQIFIPIKVVGGQADDILRLIQRYKLVGGIGKSIIRQIMFAPFSTKTEEERETLIDILTNI